MKKGFMLLGIWVIVATICLCFALSGTTSSETTYRKLSREEQIQIMKECYKDTKKVFNVGGKSTEMAITFFYYRTGMIPIAQ